MHPPTKPAPNRTPVKLAVVAACPGQLCLGASFPSAGSPPGSTSKNTWWKESSQMWSFFRHQEGPSAGFVYSPRTPADVKPASHQATWIVSGRPARGRRKMTAVCEQVNEMPREPITRWALDPRPPSVSCIARTSDRRQILSLQGRAWVRGRGARVRQSTYRSGDGERGAQGGGHVIHG